MNKEKLIEIDNSVIKIIRDSLKKLSVVCKTLGPHGQIIALENQSGNHKATKDGVSIAKCIDSKNKFESVVINMTKDVCFKTNSRVGDGTTTSILLTKSIVEAGLRLKESGYNPKDIISGIEIIKNKIIEEIKELSFVPSNIDLKNVANVAANDKKLGTLIHEAFSKVNKKYGLITVESSKSTETSLEIIHGLNIDSGSLSPYFFGEGAYEESPKIDFENPIILIYNGKIHEKHEQELLFSFLDQASMTSSPSVLFCEDIDQNILRHIIVSIMRSNLKFAAVKIPQHGDRNETVQDISVVTGAVIIDPKYSNEIKYNNSYAGSCSKIIVKKENTTIMGGNGKKENVNSRCMEIEEQLKCEDLSDYKKDKLQSRLSSLRGGIGIIKVGGSTTSEIEEKCDRITDGVCTFKCAASGKICVGGGITLNKIKKKIEKTIKQEHFSNEGEFLGAKAAIRCLESPIRQIVLNSGDNDEVVLNTINKSKNNNLGYYATKRKIEDLHSMGVFDAEDVVISTIKTSMSISCILLNMCSIVLLKENSTS